MATCIGEKIEVKKSLRRGGTGREAETRDSRPVWEGERAESPGARRAPGCLRRLATAGLLFGGGAGRGGPAPETRAGERRGGRVRPPPRLPGVDPAGAAPPDSEGMAVARGGRCGGILRRPWAPGGWLEVGGGRGDCPDLQRAGD